MLDMSIIDTLTGGILATLGGWSAIWFQSRHIRKNRIDEIMAERKVQASVEAYKYTKEIEALLTQKSMEDTLQFMMQKQDWFFNSRLFLSNEFISLWLDVRTGIGEFLRDQKSSKKSALELTNTEGIINNKVGCAIREILKDMGIKDAEVRGMKL